MDRSEPSHEMSGDSCPSGETYRFQANIHSTKSSTASCDSMIFSVIIEDDGTDFVTYVPALEFASTFGATRDEALERTRELIIGYLEAARIEGMLLDLTSHRHEVVELSVTR